MIRSEIGRGILALLTCSLVAGAAVAGDQKAVPGQWAVHEWGTFLSVQGSNGVNLGGMVDSEEHLPKFVIERSAEAWNRARLRGSFFIKVETPVTYFYTDRERYAQIHVDMKGGLLTHWYPSATDFGPPVLPKAPTAKDSFLDWSVKVVPPPAVRNPKEDPSTGMPAVSAADAWRFARETDAAFVRTHGLAASGRGLSVEAEKFLFYRGLGRFDLPLHVSTKGVGLDAKVTYDNGGDSVVGAVFLLDVDSAKGVRFREVGDLPGRTCLATPLEASLGVWPVKGDAVREAKLAVAAALTKQGLYQKESLAMVNTWEQSYFRTPGTRVLYVLPRKQVDDVMPIRVIPQPKELVRVMVGRIEVLTPDRERSVAEQVRDLESVDSARRLAAKTAIDSLGRLREPILRRIAEIGQTASVRESASRIVKSIELKVN